MRDSIHLIGAEQVSSAGYNMNSAASEMKRAASSIEDTLFRHQNFMTQWLQDFERILTENKS